jgi:hypothetical protein
MRCLVNVWFGLGLGVVAFGFGASIKFVGGVFNGVMAVFSVVFVCCFGCPVFF